jgi:hypothetical protein
MTEKERIEWALELLHELELGVPELVHPYRWLPKKLENPEIVGAEVIYSVCESRSKQIALEGGYDVFNDEDYYDPELKPQRLYDLLSDIRRG